MKKLILLLLFIPLVSFGQIKLGSKVSYTKDKITFTIKKPEPFIESNTPFGADEAKLVRSFYNAQNYQLIQIHSNPIPKDFQNEANKLMQDSEMAKSLFERTLFPSPINKLLSYKKITINSIPFYEIELITRNIEKQIAWITVYKNSLVNINSVTLTDNFNNIKGFLDNFKKHIELK